MRKQRRYRSWGAWSSTALLIVFTLKNFFDIEVPNVDEFLSLVFACGLAWGIWNNPTERDKF